MQRLQTLMLLFALSSALCQTPGSAPAPYSGRVTGKTYSNDFFGFSYKYPEELISQVESLQSLSKQFASGRATGDPNVVEQMGCGLSETTYFAICVVCTISRAGLSRTSASRSRRPE
jgi:hypothetical protein